MLTLSFRFKCREIHTTICIQYPIKLLLYRILLNFYSFGYLSPNIIQYMTPLFEWKIRKHGYLLFNEKINCSRTVDIFFKCFCEHALVFVLWCKLYRCRGIQFSIWKFHQTFGSVVLINSFSSIRYPSFEVAIFNGYCHRIHQQWFSLLFVHISGSSLEMKRD